MERSDYGVDWNTRGIDFNYTGTVKVWVTDEEAELYELCAGERDR